MPGNLSCFLIQDFMYALLQMRVVVVYYIVVREYVRRLSVKSRVVRWSWREGLYGGGVGGGVAVLLPSFTAHLVSIPLSYTHFCKLS